MWVSIDGLSWSRLRRSKLPLPHLRKLITHGVSGPLLSVYPSQTWPAHASLLTGSWPARHGVVGNHLWSRKRRKVVHAWQLPQGELMKGDTLFDASNRQGVKTANVFWPNTARAKGLNWNLPEVYGWSAFHRWASPGVLKELQRAGLPSDRITRISHEESFEFDSFATDAALHVMKRHRPGLLMVHLLSVDMLSHRYGPDSRPADWALALCDRYLGQLLAGWREAGGGGVVIVSDHGFTQVTDGIGHRLVLRAAKLTKRERAAVHVVANGHNLYLYADPTAHGTAGLARLRDHLRKDKRLDVWQTAAQMKALHLGDPGKLPWLPDAIAMMKPGVLIWGTRSARRERKPVWRGNHGHLPETPGLDGAFIASGPGFRPGTHIDQLRAVDVAPTLARHYGWPLRGTHDGQVRSEMLSSRAVATRR
ncbi:MAG: alkaline phosphatase family protein [Myxococcales bacterium]|nr:alkaline phosphatase family protein [Myxococcales bacterium]